MVISKMKSKNIPNPAKMTKERSAGKAEDALTKNATKSVRDVMKIETPANLIVLLILFDMTIFGLI